MLEKFLAWSPESGLKPGKCYVRLLFRTAFGDEETANFP